jgi:hypothetical protein
MKEKTHQSVNTTAGITEAQYITANILHNISNNIQHLWKKVVFSCFLDSDAVCLLLVTGLACLLICSTQIYSFFGFFSTIFILLRKVEG